MKKFIAVIPIAIFFILLSLNINVFAYTGTIIIYGDPYRSACRCVQYDGNPVLVSDNGNIRIEDGDSRYIGSAEYPFGTESLDGYIRYLNNNQVSFGYSGVHYSTNIPSNTEVIYVYTGYIINNSDIGDNILYNPNVPQPPEEPSWWEILWDTFNDYFTNPIPGGWIKNLIDNVFGDNENETNISDSFDFANPTITPAPTPIPYSTVVIPKTDPVTGDTYYETNYIYNNPSGTPIVQPYPPSNAPSTNTPSGGTEYIPVNGDPYSIPFVNWLTNTNIGDSNYNGLDSIGDGMNSVDEIGSEYIDGIGAAQDATSALPTSWLLLIGIAAAIPLLAGIISRFLS